PRPRWPRPVAGQMVPCADPTSEIPTVSCTDPERVEQARANLRAARSRIEAACAEAGRDPKDVSLVAVTKTYPADDVRILASLGVTDVGENRDQEAAPKEIGRAHV